MTTFTNGLAPQTIIRGREKVRVTLAVAPWYAGIGTFIQGPWFDDPTKSITKWLEGLTGQNFGYPASTVTRKEDQRGGIVDIRVNRIAVNKAVTFRELADVLSALVPGVSVVEMAMVTGAPTSTEAAADRETRRTADELAGQGKTGIAFIDALAAKANVLANGLGDVLVLGGGLTILFLVVKASKTAGVR